MLHYCIADTLEHLTVQFAHLSLEIVDNETLRGVSLEVFYEGSLALAISLRALYLELSQSWSTSCFGDIAMIVNGLHYTFCQSLQNVSCDLDSEGLDVR